MTTFRTYAELLEEARSRVREVTADEAMRTSDANTVYLDCREPKEWNLGHIPGAVLVPLGALGGEVEAVVPREKRVVIYCARGNRSALAADTMQQMGYANVASMKGGIGAWVDAGGEIE